MKFAKSVIDRLVFTDVDYFKKGLSDWKRTGRDEISRQEDYRGINPSTTTIKLRDRGKTFDLANRKEYTYNPKNQKVHVQKVTDKKRESKTITANAAHEKELKNASLHAALDELLEKGRPRTSERKDPNRRKAEASDDNLIIPDTKHVQTMSNPGPTEAEHYERTKGGSIENLKRLAESKHPMDRKAAAAGMKKHE